MSQSKIKIMIIGGDGQLGYDLVRVLSKNFHVVSITRQQLDITTQQQCKSVISKYKPGVVINCAAFHNTEECEANPQKAFDVNAVGAFYVARASSQISATVIYISTNYVFDGTQSVYYEDDYPNPINVYGTSKLAGELLTHIGSKGKSYIIRTAGLFGINPSRKGYNFVSLMLRKAKSDNVVKVVNTEWSSITYCLDLASVILQLIKTRSPFGIYHVVNQGNSSWFDIANYVFSIMKIQTPLVPVTTYSKNSLLLQRPRRTILASNKLRKLGIQPLRPWQSSVSAYLRELQEQNSGIIL